MRVKVAISARHVHLDLKTKEILFGEQELTKQKELSQKGQYACNETLTVKTEKNRIDNVRILGPLRNHTQVEVSKTDALKLRLNPPVRDSGDLMNSETITLIYKDKEVEVKECCIIAKRHIHVDGETSKRLNLKDKDIVKLKIDTPRGGILSNTLVRVDEMYTFEVHLDTDEGNALGLTNEKEVEILK